MARMRRLAAVVAGVVATSSLIGLGAPGGGAPAGAAASEVIPLGVPGARDLVVDDATGRVFLAVGDQVLVRAADGSAVATIDDVDGASALTTGLGSVWALAADSADVVRIDPATAAVTDTLPVDVASGLIGLAVADGAVWTTGTATGAGTVLVEVAPEAPPGAFPDTAHPLPAGTDRMLLDATPGAPDLLVAGEITAEATTYVFDVGGEAPEVQASTDFSNPVTDLAVSTDGSEVTIVGWGRSYSTDDLTEVDDPLGPYGSFAAARRQVGNADVVALGGYELTGVFSYGAKITVHQTGEADPAVVDRSGVMGSFIVPIDVYAGLAFAPDGEHLYVLENPVDHTADPDPDAQLRVIDLVPVVHDVAPRVVGTVGGGSVEVHGPDLGTATVTVGGQPATRTSSGIHSSTFTVPALPAGGQPLVLTRLGLDVTASEPVVVRDLGPFRDTGHYVTRLRQDLPGGGPLTEVPAVDADLAAGGSLGELPARLVVGDGTERYDAPLIRLYQAMFLRPPDLPGLRYWQEQRWAGRSLTWIASAMAGSSEFKSRYGTLSNAAFVDRIYLNVLGRPAEPAGKQYWTGVLASGQPRGKVVLHFAGSAEFKTRTAPNLPVFGLYEGMLQRSPKAAEMAAALEVVRTSSLEALAASLVTSAEYIARVQALD